MSQPNDPHHTEAEYEGEMQREEEARRDMFNTLTFERAMRSRGARIVRHEDDPGTPAYGKLASDTTLKIFCDAYGKELVAAAISLHWRLSRDFWTDQSGRTLKPAEMDVSHAHNLVAVAREAIPSNQARRRDLDLVHVWRSRRRRTRT